MATLEELSKQIQELKKQYVLQSRELFKKTTDEIFEQHENLEAFGWRQGTPGFCDGDPCYFHIYAKKDNLELIFNKEATNFLFEHGVSCQQEYGDTAVFSQMNLDPYYFKGKDTAFLDEYQNIAESISSFLYGMDENTLREMFGDGIHVTIYRDGRTELDDTYIE